MKDVKRYWPYVGNAEYTGEYEAKMMLDPMGEYVKYSAYKEIFDELMKYKREEDEKASKCTTN